MLNITLFKLQLGLKRLLSTTLFKQQLDFNFVEDHLIKTTIGAQTFVEHHLI